MRRLLARGSWLEVTKGVYLVERDAVAPTDWPARLRQRAIAGMLVGGADAVAVGSTALALDGVQGMALTFRPEYVREHGRHRNRAAVTQRRLVPRPPAPGLPQRLTNTGGWRRATTVWALAQALPGLDRDHAVSILDSALNLERVAPAELETVGSLLARRRGVAAVRTWMPLADARAESPLETRSRLDCWDHGVAPHDLQREIWDGCGRFVARCDMVWELGKGRLLIVELDGAHHRQNGQAKRDNLRDTRLTSLGHVVYHFDWADLVSGAIWRTVARELQRHGVLAA